MDINTNISAIILNINGPNAPVKTQSALGNEKDKSYCMLFTTEKLKIQGQRKSANKRMVKGTL